jgi:hypothetical protein
MHSIYFSKHPFNCLSMFQIDHISADEHLVILLSNTIIFPINFLLISFSLDKTEKESQTSSSNATQFI